MQPIIHSAPVFRPILKTALQIIRKYPWLLFFGFLMSFLGAGGFWELLTNVGQTSLSTTRLVAALPVFLQWEHVTSIMHGIGAMLRTSPLSFLTLSITFLTLAGLTIGIFWIAGASHGALIDTAQKSAFRLRSTFRAGWAVGRRCSLRVLSIHLVIKFAIFLLFLLGGILIEGTLRVNGLLFVIALLIFIALVGASLIAVLLTMYATAYSVIKNFSFPEALRSALHLFTRNWLVSLELSSIFFLLSLALGIGALFVLFLLTLPLIFLFMIASAFVLPGGASLIITLWFIVAILLFASTTAFFSAWQTIAWILLFIRLSDEGALPKLVRLSQKWFG